VTRFPSALDAYGKATEARVLSVFRPGAPNRAVRAKTV
jgi:hypothetical protein